MTLTRIGLIVFTLLALNCPCFGQTDRYTRIDFHLGDISPYGMKPITPMYTTSHPGDLHLLLERITNENPAVALTMMNSWYVPNDVLRFISFRKDDGHGPWSADVASEQGWQGTVSGKPEKGAVTFREWLITNGFVGVDEFYSYLLKVTEGKRPSLSEIATAGRAVGISGGFTTSPGDANERVAGLNNGTAPVMGEPSEYTFARLVPKPPPPPAPPAPAPVVAPVAVTAPAVEAPGVAEIVSGKASFGEVLADNSSPEPTGWRFFVRSCRFIIMGF